MAKPKSPVIVEEDDVLDEAASDGCRIARLPSRVV
jgi:hypothetical protein